MRLIIILLLSPLFGKAQFFVEYAYINTYYVSATGNDNNNGSFTSPFQTVGKINTLNLTNKSVLFKAGQTFSGNLLVTNNNVFIGSYGTGQATISAGNGSGIILQDCDYVTVKNLSIYGTTIDTTTGAIANAGYGIRALSTSTVTGYRYGINIDSVLVDGFRYGIEFKADNGATLGSQTSWRGYSGARITNSEIRYCAHTALRFNANNSTSSTYNLIHKNVYMTRLNVHNMYGNPSLSTSYENANYGTGIRTNFVDSGTVEYCRINNAGHSGSVWGSPANFEAENASNITWQYNESSNCRMTGIYDGAGFDVWDGSTQNMLIQYNYSHENDGYGIGGGNQGFGSPNTGHIARFNLLVNNNILGYVADIQLWGEMTGCKIYNNTIYSNKNGSKILEVVNNTGIVFANNIIVSKGTRPLGSIANAATTFLNNTYYANGTTSFGLVIGSVTYNTLASLQVANYEKQTGVNYGFAGLPTFANDGNSSFFLMAQNVSNQNAYNIASGTGFGTFVSFPTITGNIGTKDFHNNTFTAPTNIGAMQ